MFYPADPQLDRQIDALIRDVGRVPGCGIRVIKHPRHETAVELRSALTAALDSVNRLDLLLGDPSGLNVVC